MGQVDLAGISPTLHLMAIQEAMVMPMGLPSSRPRKMPMPTPPRVASYANTLKYDGSVISTPALARAKMGMIRKLTQGLSLCSSR